MGAPATPQTRPQTAIVMGVSGCGKTTIARHLAAQLGWHFVEGDAFHPAENRAKMARGVPLTDADRLPWLRALRAEMLRLRAGDRGVVLACSALKRQYRQILGDSATVWIYLRGDAATIRARLQRRSGHFMPASLLQSQLETLEEPDGERALAVDCSQSIREITEQVVRHPLICDGGRSPKSSA